jgi:DNA mismatch repair protein MutS
MNKENLPQKSFDFSYEKAIKNSTPMMQQYLNIKSQYKDCLLFYRMGDFYEMFFEDAVAASSLLKIALTKRGKHESQDIPMCGIPFHSSEPYLHKLIEAGHKVAICEQLESPEEAKKRGYKAIVRREVVRVVTPGTITEESLLNSVSLNYLLSITKSQAGIAISWIDLSTGEFNVMNSSIDNIISDIARLNPKEILVSEKVFADTELKQFISEWRNKLTTQVNSFFDFNRSELRLKSFYNVKFLDSFGSFSKEQICSCGAILEYLLITQKDSMPRLNIPRIQNKDSFMAIDLATRRNLELTQSLSGANQGSLLSIIDKTMTSMGGRLIHKYISSPLIDCEAISKRQEMVQFFYDNTNVIEHLVPILKRIPDFERALARLMVNRGGPRDLLSIRSALQQVLYILEVFEHFNITIPDHISNYLLFLNNFEELILQLSDGLNDDVPINLKDGLVIKRGYSLRLDELYNITENSQSKLNELKQKYIKQTGITNLKITKNNILGFYIEITPINADKIDNNIFKHRQSLATSVRYTTDELKQLESDIINAEDLIIKLETELFKQLVDSVLLHSEKIYLLAQAIAIIDVMSGLARVAVENNYVRPIIDNSKDFILVKARHPVIELSLARNNEFISNDINLHDKSKIYLLTGPNMAGKSTYLRQNALIAILSQIGSFVPAEYAKIGIVDKIYSRIGASDDLARGRSTFMVEMVETATILNHATDKSLVILDEIGRGTSTYDGLSIAWSCLEYIHNKIDCRTLFATHYQELSNLVNHLSKLKCYTMSVKEWQDKIIFLHKIIEGVTDRSYGVHVAKLAGLPDVVVNRAEEILQTLELPAIDSSQIMQAMVQPQKDLNSKIEIIIRDINIDEITPREALDVLAELKKFV